MFSAVSVFFYRREHEAAEIGAEKTLKIISKYFNGIYCLSASKTYFFYV